MRILTPLILFITFLASCSTKEKELPSYFCNENLERYFAGNDSLPTININPNDSFGVIRKSVDSLYKNLDYPPNFRFPINLTDSSKTIFIQTRFFNYYPDGFDALTGCGNMRNVLEVLLTSKNQLLIEGELFEVDSLQSFVFKFITNYGKDPNYSDHPSIATISLQKDTTVNSNTYFRIIKSVIDGYNATSNYESKRKYRKLFCELNTAESSIISEIIPFNFYIEYPETNPYYLNPYQPLPPTPFDDSLFDAFVRYE
jgi:hypothetical protein